LSEFVRPSLDIGRLSESQSNICDRYGVRGGTGFRRLLEATRMEEAVRLLGDRSQTLTGIAEILGYSDLSGLSHAVRSHWGSSPRHLREEILSTSGYATLTEPSLARQMNSN